MSGIDTTLYDQYRQGIYAHGHHLRRGILPVMGPEITGSVLIQTTFGQPKTFSDNTPFDDLAKFVPEVYLNDTGSMYPAIIGNVDLSDPEQDDGAIEPFTIRSIISFTSTEFPFSARGIKGSLGEGNTDGLLKTDLIVSEIEFKSPSTVDPFIDADDRMGDTVAGAIRLPGLFPDDQKTTPFFLDNYVEQKVFIETPTGEDMLSALSAMTGSATENYMNNDQVSAGKGHTFEYTYLGVDSIAFGGLRRS